MAHITPCAPFIPRPQSLENARLLGAPECTYTTAHPRHARTRDRKVHVAPTEDRVCVPLEHQKINGFDDTPRI